MSEQEDIGYKIAVEMFGKETADRMKALKSAVPAGAAPASSPFVPKAGGNALRSPTGSIPSTGIPMIPPHISSFLGPHGSLNDSLSGEAVGWGWPVIGRMGEELWSEAQGYGTMVYDHGNWYLIHRQLTREEAIQKFGPAQDEYGPRGGWKQVMFGSTLFKHKCLKPQK